MRLMRTAFAWILGLTVVSDRTLADPIVDFYKGRQISWILSADAGGGYSSYARAFAPYLSNYIPGKPVIVIQNMPGGGGLRAMNYLFSVAPSDGATIGLVHSGVPFAPLYGIKGAKFDPRQMHWIGSIATARGICVAWHTAKIETWQDLLDRQFVVGGSGVGSQMETIPAMLNKLFGTRIKVISGYKGGNEIYLAMERGEVWTGEGSPTLAERSKRLPEFRAKNRRPIDRKFVRSIFERDHPGTADDAVIEAFADAILKLDDSVPTGTYVDMCANLPVCNPEKITVPTLIMRGEFDGIASFQDLVKFFEKLPNPDKQFAVMPGIAHASFHQKNYAICYHILESFFAQPAPIYRAAH